MRDQQSLYRGPFYVGEGRRERRALISYYVPHVKTVYPRRTPDGVDDPRMGLCRICGLPGADCPAPVL